MKSKGIRHVLAIAVGTIVSIFVFLSCDPLVWCDIYIENETSGKCIVYAINDTSSIAKQDTLVINSGESATIESFEDFGWASIEYAQDIVSHWLRVDYQCGIRIVFEDGSSIEYYPDSVNTQIHSPYDKNSYSYELVSKHIVHASYIISDIEDVE